jgi:hypothetical protein
MQEKMNVRSAASIMLAAAGWVTACVAVIGIWSLWYAVKLGLDPVPYRTPIEWIVGRAFLVGLPLSAVPICLFLWFSRKSSA